MPPFQVHPCPPPSNHSAPSSPSARAIFRDGKILLVRRARSPGKGFYSLPGGRVEFGESLHTALHREVDEETGAENRDCGLAGWREVLPGAGGGGHYLIMSFAARWTAREPVLNDEHDDFKWLDAGCARRSQGHRRPAGGHRRRPGGSFEAERLVSPTLTVRLASSALRRHIGRVLDPNAQALSRRSHPHLGMPSRPRAGPGCRRAVRRRSAAAGRNPRHAALSARHLRHQ